MVLIREVVEHAFATGYLSLAAENQLRQLLTTKYEEEDLNAFITLQQAVMDGCVLQESREIRQYQHEYLQNCSEESRIFEEKKDKRKGFIKSIRVPIVSLVDA